MNNTHKIFGVTGWKNSGKTHLVSSLVTEFTKRGLKVSTVKHAHHAFDIDHEGTDSWKHRKSGAGEVALVSNKRWAIMHELKDEQEPPLEEVLEKLSACDLVLIEGYKREGHPKIECIRKEASRDEPIWPNDNSIVAIAGTMNVSTGGLPLLDIENIPSIADFILDSLKLANSNAAQ